MKVVRVSNYDDEGPLGNQYVVAGPGLSLEDAELEAERRCYSPTRDERDWYRVVPDDYVPWVFEP